MLKNGLPCLCTDRPFSIDLDGALGPVLNFLTWVQILAQLDWPSPPPPETSLLLS